MLHACTRVYAEQRPAAPSGHAQSSGRTRFYVCTCNQSINPSVVSQSCKMQSFPSARSRLSPRMHPTSSLSLSNNRPPWSSGVQCSSQHPLSTLCHREKVTSRASVRSCRPSHLTDTPHLSDWAYIRLILRFLPPSTQSHDLVCMPPAVAATRARITRTLLVNAMQRTISHDIPPCAARFMHKKTKQKKTHSSTSLQ